VSRPWWLINRDRTGLHMDGVENERHGRGKERNGLLVREPLLTLRICPHKPTLAACLFHSEYSHNDRLYVTIAIPLKGARLVSAGCEASLEAAGAGR
jgi:hypothetical protein